MNLFQKAFQESGFTYQELGDKFGKTRQFVEFLVKHPQSSGISNILKLGAVLNMDIDDIKKEYIRIKFDYGIKNDN